MTLIQLKELIEAGYLKSVIERVYPLEQIRIRCSRVWRSYSDPLRGREKFVIVFFRKSTGRIFALIILVCGLAIITTGAVEILFPARFDQWIVAIQDWQQDLKCQINPYYCGE